jgi:hypothetical protein
MVWACDANRRREMDKRNILIRPHPKIGREDDQGNCGMKEYLTSHDK